MGPEGFTNQRGAIQLRSPRRNFRGAEQFGIEDDLDCFHMWSPLHSILHNNLPAGFQVEPAPWPM